MRKQNSKVMTENHQENLKSLFLSTDPANRRLAFELNQKQCIEFFIELLLQNEFEWLDGEEKVELRWNRSEMDFFRINYSSLSTNTIFNTQTLKFYTYDEDGDFQEENILDFLEYLLD